ncbi:MAG: GTP-binding protein [Candidatus Woesearchaeota archaeon]|nr:MAG: GTP-binding protein [Candidatus Woesearchaeota archaeon]
MPDYSEEIRELEEKIANTKYNKSTQYAIGLMKAKLARLKEKESLRGSGTKKSEGYDVRKTGDGTVILIGFPSVGKSTLLNDLTNAESKTAEYAFTTLKVIPGIMNYNDAKIQILDVPGIVSGAASGVGRGKEVLSVMRGADLALIIIDVNQPEHYPALLKEIYDANIRINKKSPDVKIVKTTTGGLRIASTIKLTKIDIETIKIVLKEFKIINADIIIRSDIDVDELIDVIEGNKKYIPALTIINKIDLATEEQIKKVVKNLKADLAISAKDKIYIEHLKELIFENLNLIRIYLKEPGKEPDLDVPLIIRRGYTVKDVCNKLHKDFISKFKFCRIWGRSSKFPGQKLMLDHKLEDKDILEIHLR